MGRVYRPFFSPMKHYPASVNTIPFDAIELNWPATGAMFTDGDGTNACMLVAVDWRAISTLISCLRFAELPAIWGLPENRDTWSAADKNTWFEISAFIADLEVSLMTGCNVSDLIKTNRMIVAAIVGEEIQDLDSDLPTSVDYTETGLSPRLLAIKDAVSSEDVQDNIDNVTLAIEALTAVMAA